MRAKRIAGSSPGTRPGWRIKTACPYPSSRDARCAALCAAKIGGRVGCERHCPAEKIIELIETTLKVNKLHPKAIAALASIDLKADEQGLQQAAAHFGVPLRVFTANELAQERDRVPNPSAIVEQEVGTPSVAEAAAIKAGEIAG